MKNTPYWYVWAENNRAPTYKHTSEKSAIQEAERLAHVQPGQRFLVMCVIGAAYKAPMPAVYQAYDEIPF